MHFVPKIAQLRFNIVFSLSTASLKRFQKVIYLFMDVPELYAGRLWRGFITKFPIPLH